MKTITAAKNFPNDKQAHLCVVEFVSVRLPDEPADHGRGMEPGGTQTYSNFYLFDNEQELLAWVERWGSRKNYLILTGQQVNVTSTTQLRY